MNGENKESEKIDRMVHVAGQDPQDYHEVAALLEPELVHDPIVNRSVKLIGHPSKHVTIKGALMVAVTQLSEALRMSHEELAKREMEDAPCVYRNKPPADCTDTGDDMTDRITDEDRERIEAVLSEQGEVTLCNGFDGRLTTMDVERLLDEVDRLKTIAASALDWIDVPEDEYIRQTEARAAARKLREVANER